MLAKFHSVSNLYIYYFVYLIITVFLLLSVNNLDVVAVSVPYDPNGNLVESQVFSTYCSHSINGTGDWGYRRYTLDRFIHEYIDLSETLTAAVIGVVDGMHGSYIADTLSKVMGTALQVKFNQRLKEPLSNISVSVKENPPLISQISRVINETMLYLDKMICEQYEPAQLEGASISMTLIIADFAFIVNLGDSRTMLLADSKLKYVTEKHIRQPLKPSHIKHLRQSDEDDNGEPSSHRHRRNPLQEETMLLLNSLPVSHSFGHCKYKRTSGPWYSMLTSSTERYDGVNGAVKSTPEITVRRLYLHRGVTYELFSGTRGLFDVMEVKEIAYYLNMMYVDQFDESKSPICKNIVMHAHDRKPSDDVTAVYLKLTPVEPGEQEQEENN